MISYFKNQTIEDPNFYLQLFENAKSGNQNAFITQFSKAIGFKISTYEKLFNVSFKRRRELNNQLNEFRKLTKDKTKHIKTPESRRTYLEIYEHEKFWKQLRKLVFTFEIVRQHFQSNIINSYVSMSFFGKLFQHIGNQIAEAVVSQMAMQIYIEMIVKFNEEFDNEVDIINKINSNFSPNKNFDAYLHFESCKIPYLGRVFTASEYSTDHKSLFVQKVNPETTYEIINENMNLLIKPDFSQNAIVYSFLLHEIVPTEFKRIDISFKMKTAIQGLFFGKRFIENIEIANIEPIKRDNLIKVTSNTNQGDMSELVRVFDTIAGEFDKFYGKHDENLELTDHILYFFFMTFKQSFPDLSQRQYAFLSGYTMGIIGIWQNAEQYSSDYKSTFEESITSKAKQKLSKLKEFNEPVLKPEF